MNYAGRYASSAECGPSIGALGRGVRSAAVFVLAVILMCGAASAVPAGEVGFLERFALAPDREAVLKELIPGTDDYYYFHCLHFQTTEQYDRAEEVLAAWKKQHPSSGRWKSMMHRQRLLTYDRNPDATFAYLKDEFKLRFDHAAPRAATERRLPAKLDPKLIERSTLTQQAMRPNNRLNGFEDSALDWLLELKLNEAQTRDLLSRLRRPDSERLVDVVLADLNTRNSGGFGSLPIHRLLLRSQLDELRRRRPDLLNNSNYVNVYLQKLAPADDVDWTGQPEAEQAYLDRLWSFVSQLGPVHSSLKANVLYHRLQFDRGHGVYDRQRFLEYIKLPRRAEYVNRRWAFAEPQQRFLVNMNADYSAAIKLPPIRRDDDLVRAYLLHFFADAVNYDDYREYLDETYLRKVFAEAKLVNGLGDAERWFAYLSPQELNALRDRVDIDFAPENRESFAPQDEVTLDVWVKNANPLLIKVFEIDSIKHYQQTQREIDTSVNLDGLVPNIERVVKFEEPPIRRVRRRFAFPELKQPGIYVIDFIGNGKSSRALIRKGTLSYVVRDGAGGHVFTVFDGAGKKVNDAQIWLSGRVFDADEHGQIAVPYSSSPRQQQIVLMHKGLGVLHTFAHHAEQYTLHASFAVDREALLDQQLATLLIRSGLFLNGTRIPQEVLESVTLTMHAVNQDGVQSSRTFSGVKLSDEQEAAISFRVPSDVRGLQFVLQAKIKNMTTGKEETLSVSQSVSINQIDATDRLVDVHLVPTPDGYHLAALGRTGEIRPGTVIQLQLKHRDFRAPVNVSLQADDGGRVVLGPLPDILQVTATPAGGQSRSWTLPDVAAVPPALLHAAAGQLLRVPLPNGKTRVTREYVALLEKRRGTYVADHFDKLAERGGSLQISGLSGGEYELFFKRQGLTIPIRVTQGEYVDGFVIGKSWRLQLTPGRGIWDLTVDVQPEQLVVRPQGELSEARVHVVATKFFPAFGLGSVLSRIPESSTVFFEWRPARSAYVTGRKIGDEYEYILRRKYAAKHPGNMLHRPGLLLNPWAVRDTTTGRQDAEAGGEFLAKGSNGGIGGRSSGVGSFSGGQFADFADLNFLTHPSLTLANVKLGENGQAVIARKDFAERHVIRVVAVQPSAVVERTVILPEQAAPIDDLRLLTGLDPQKHYVQLQIAKALRKGESVSISDITTSRFAIYDTVGGFRNLLRTLQPHPAWDRFSFLDRWHTLSAEERQTFYSKNACHELHVFLAFKDPEFFARVVKPYLAHKHQPTFVDAWLTGGNVEPFVTSFNYDRLNIAERVLLARRSADPIAAAIRRQLGDLQDLIPPDPNRDRTLFETAVRGQMLEEEERLRGLTDALETAKKSKTRRGREQMNALEKLADAPANGPRGEMAARPAAAPPGFAGGLGGFGGGLGAGKDAKARHAAPTDAADRNGDGARRDLRMLDEAEAAEAKQFFGRAAGNKKADAERDLQRRKSNVYFYRPLEQTKEWAEMNYFELRLAQESPELVPINRYWLDAAAGREAAPVLSAKIAEASRNFHEGMLALAMLDVPFEAAEHDVEYAGTGLTLKASGNTVVYYEEVQERPVQQNAAPVLATQNFFRKDDRYQTIQGQQFEKFVTQEFLTHVVYGAQVVVTNPTSRPRQLNVLLQVPLGAVPVQNGHYTRTVPVTLAPFRTEAIEYYFYFPRAGEFPQFPAHVSEDGNVVAFAKGMTFHVVEEPEIGDRDSWNYIAQHGSDEDVLQFVRTRNVFAIDPARVAYRLKNREFFSAFTGVLTQRQRYDDTVFSYGIYHKDADVTVQYLKRQRAFVAACGPVLASRLLTIDPVGDRFYEFLEYDPLVNARAHQLGRQRKILNDAFFVQYMRLLDILSRRRAPSPEDRLAVTYYFLLQDRVDEAAAQFGQIDRDTVHSQLQYDYARAYLAMFSPDTTQVAQEIAAHYEQHPVERWRNRFRGVLAHLREISEPAGTFVDDTNTADVNTKLAAQQPALDVEAEGAKIRLNYQNLNAVDVRYFRMDIELLFSRSPFVQRYSDLVASIRPNASARVELPADQMEFTFELPADLQQENVLVQVSGGGLVRTVVSYAHSLSVQMFENAGQLRVVSREDGKPIPATYVKVYARLSDGTVRFYKDGYTDLRGRFDYVALSTNEVDQVARFAILILSEQHGALVREAAPPKR